MGEIARNCFRFEDGEVARADTRRAGGAASNLKSSYAD